MTVASDNIHNTFGLDEIITGRANLFPQVKIFNAENPNVVQMASYMAFDISGPKISAASTSQPGPPMEHNRQYTFRSGAEIYVSLRGARTIRVFRGDTGGTITTIGPWDDCSHPVSPGASTSQSVSRPLPPRSKPGNLIVVGAEGPFVQIPIVFPGGPFSPAGLNGQFPAA